MVLLGPAPPPGAGLPPQEHLPRTEEHVLKGHEGPVLAVRFNTQGTYCLSCGKVRPARPPPPARPHTGLVGSPSPPPSPPALHPGWLAANGGLLSPPGIPPYHTTQPLPCLLALPAPPTPGHLLPHPASSPTPLQDRTVRLWNPHRGIPIKVYTGHGYDVRDAAVVTDNS